MPYIIAILGALTAGYFFVMRARNAAEMTGELMDVANDVRLAARRFGFRRKLNVHPVENIEDPKLAIGGIASAFLELDDLPTREQRDALDRALRDQLRVDAREAQEITVLGRWFVTECGGADAAVARLSRKLAGLGGAESFQPLLKIVNATLTAGTGSLNDRQREALDAVKNAFRIS